MATEYVHVMEKWSSNWVEVWMSSPDGWKLVSKERIYRQPFVRLDIMPWPWVEQVKGDEG